MSNIQSMTIEQLNGYREYLSEGISQNFNSMFDGETFADLIDLHDYCRAKRIEVALEIESRKNNP